MVSVLSGEATVMLKQRDEHGGGLRASEGDAALYFTR